MRIDPLAKCGLVAAGVLTIAAFSYGGDGVKEVVKKSGESCITGDIGVNIVSQYISKGVVYENQGAIVQPYVDLFFTLYEGDGFVNKVTLNLGTWGSFQSRKDTGFGRSTADRTRSWYEEDFTFGTSLTFAKNFTLTPTYDIFISPNSAFDTFHGLNVKLAYDDTDLLGAFAVHPYVQVLWELQNKFGTGTDEGVNYEVGIAPSFAAGPVTVTIPVTAGFGSHDFYQNEFGGNEAFGWFSAGVSLSYVLKFIPEWCGAWTVNAGYTYYALGDGSDYAYSDRVGGTIRKESDHAHVFQGGLMVAF